MEACGLELSPHNHLLKGKTTALEQKNLEANTLVNPVITQNRANFHLGPPNPTHHRSRVPRNNACPEANP